MTALHKLLKTNFDRNKTCDNFDPWQGWRSTCKVVHRNRYHGVLDVAMNKLALFGRVGIQNVGLIILAGFVLCLLFGYAAFAFGLLNPSIFGLIIAVAVSYPFCYPFFFHNNKCVDKAELFDIQSILFRGLAFFVGGAFFATWLFDRCITRAVGLAPHHILTKYEHYLTAVWKNAGTIIGWFSVFVFFSCLVRLILRRGSIRKPKLWWHLYILQSKTRSLAWW